MTEFVQIYSEKCTCGNLLGILQRYFNDRLIQLFDQGIHSNTVALNIIMEELNIKRLCCRLALLDPYFCRILDVGLDKLKDEVSNISGRQVNALGYISERGPDLNCIPLPPIPILPIS